MLFNYTNEPFQSNIFSPFFPLNNSSIFEIHFKIPLTTKIKWKQKVKQNERIKESNKSIPFGTSNKNCILCVSTSSIKWCATSSFPLTIILVQSFCDLLWNLQTHKKCFLINKSFEKFPIGSFTIHSHDRNFWQGPKNVQKFSYRSEIISNFNINSHFAWSWQ